MADVLDLEEFGDERSLEGNDFPDPGQFHLVITEVDDSRSKGNFIKPVFTVLNGTVDGQANKRFDEAFWDPDPGHVDGGKFAKKKLARLAMATGLITPGSLGSRVEIDWQDLKFRQLKAAVRPYTRDSKGKTYKGVEIDGLEIWGPHDPAAEHIPVDEDAIQMARELGQTNLKAVATKEEKKPVDPKEAMRQKAAAAKGATGGGTTGGTTGGGATTTPAKSAEGSAAKPASTSTSAANPAAAAKKDPYANL